MKLSIKMILVFAIVMVISIAMLSSYTVDITLTGSADFTKARFESMSLSISESLEQDFSIMRMTLNTLVENTSFMAALNQFVRDDSEDQKMADSARTAALQQLYQSPLVGDYYRVAFYNRDGLFFSSTVENGAALISGSEEAVTLINSLPALDEIDAGAQEVIFSAHSDPFTLSDDVLVYGIVQPVEYHGVLLGYLSIVSEVSDLEELLVFVDNTDEVSIEIVFDGDDLLYASSEDLPIFSADISAGEIQLWEDSDSGETYEVWRTYIEDVGLNLYVVENNSVTVGSEIFLRRQIIVHSLYIAVPALFAIILISLGLTKSIRHLTRKVQQTPSAALLANNPEVLTSLTSTITSQSDKEVYLLEKAYNDMMLRLRDSTINELHLREGTLQAQLKALQTQINPHFIYNTLNIISAKAMESGNLEIIEICDQFASMLRYSTDTRSNTATVEEEIENVRDYLLLSKARFEDNLEFTIDVPDGLSSVTVPKLTLQPLVENALTHGYDGKNMLRILSITGTIEDKRLVLEIRDNGTGFSEEMLQNLNKRIDEIYAGKVSIEQSGSHIGLINTCTRLYYYSNGSIRFSIHNDMGAVITLTMLIE